MNMKDTVILLIFLLSVLGLIMGIYYTEDINGDKSHGGNWERLYEDSDGIMTITLEKKEQKNDLSWLFT